MMETIRYYQFAEIPVRFSYYLLLSRNERLLLMKQLVAQAKKEVSIFAYCLMPNHFHFMGKQLRDKGISRFVANITNSYTKYFNTKHKRVGPLVQGTFKAVRVETDEQLIHLSRYIHLNPVTSFLVEMAKLDNYSWSSYLEYLGKKDMGICDTTVIKSHFPAIDNYRQFILDQAAYARELKKIAHVSIEDA